LKDKRKNIKLWGIALGGVILVITVAWIFAVRLEGGKPSIVLDLKSPYLNGSQTLSATVTDENTGVRRVWIGLVKDGKEAVLFQKDWPGGGLLRGGQVHRESFTIEIEPKKFGLTDGKAILRMVVRDYSWRGWGHGNRTYIEKDVTIDTVSPDINILTRVHNISPGGSGLVIFRVSEPCPQSGVFVGEDFFPGHSGYFKNPNIITAFFALKHSQGPGVEMFVSAADYAGNKARAGFPHYLKAKAFKNDMIAVPDRFLNWKMPEFDVEMRSDSTTSMLDKFLKVNQDLRRANYLQIIGFTGKTANEIYWKGAFLRLPNSARKAGYADHRKYTYQGRVIDQQVHLGIDLASVAHSPVPAANVGKVVFAGSIGIYGKTVIIDHGLGLFSMYSHLSGFEVREGQSVTKAQIIGRTGSTGLAAGDHLHFSMLVHHEFVNPVEWWDAAWIKNNITGKLDAVKALN